MSSPYPYNTLFTRDRRIRIYDERFADTYDIFLDETFEFDYAIRWMDRVGFNPIHYDDVKELPMIHQYMVEDAIVTYRKKHKNDSPDSHAPQDGAERKASHN